MGTQGHRKEGIFRTQVGSEGPQRDARMGTWRVTDGGMGGQGHSQDLRWRCGGTGGFLGAGWGWRGRKGTGRDTGMGTRRVTDGGMGTQRHGQKGIFRTWMGMEGAQRDRKGGGDEE